MNKITIGLLTEDFTVTDELDSNITKISHYIYNTLGVNVKSIKVTPSQETNINIVDNEFPEDVERIKNVMKTNVSDKLATEIWKTVSEYFCAGWLTLPENDTDLYNMIREFYLLKRFKQ